jgi:hypothetical protein
MSTPTSTLLLPIPQGYSRVLLAASGGLILNTFHSFSIGNYFRPRRRHHPAPTLRNP